MISALEGQLAALVGEALTAANLPFVLTVTRATLGGGPAHNPDPPILTDYSCQGFVDSFDANVIDGSSVLRSDVKVLILAGTLAVRPEPGDRVVARGKTYVVVNVATDPAEALFELQARA